MSLIKPLDEISIEDIQELVDNCVPESSSLDYKEQLYENTSKGKDEFLKDVTALSNMDGGHVIIGIRERRSDENEHTGEPEEIVPIECSSPDSQIQDWLNFIRDCVEPELRGIDIRPVKADDSKYVFVIRVQKSYQSPHAVRFDRSKYRFHARFSSRSESLSVAQIRALFQYELEFRDLIERSRNERLNKIEFGETPVKLNESAKICVHVWARNFPVVLDYLESASTLEYIFEKLTPYRSGRLSAHSIDFDGVTLHPDYSPSHDIYAAVFFNGLFEMVIAAGYKEKTYDFIDINSFEYYFMYYWSRIADVFHYLGLEHPVFIGVSALGIKGYSAAEHDRDFHHGIRYCSNKDKIIAPIVKIDNQTNDITAEMRNVLNRLWHEFGINGSERYDKNTGEWKGDNHFRPLEPRKPDR